MDYIKKKLEKTLSHKRYVHSLNVMITSGQLASRFGVDRERAELAGLLHDCARDIRGPKALELCSKYGIEPDEISARQTELLHGPIGAHMAREEFGIDDAGILSAIGCHTTGKPGMDTLALVVFVADFIEPGRNFPLVEDIRSKAEESLEKAAVMGIDSTIRYIIGRGGLLHPDTTDTRNWILLNFDLDGK